MDLSKLFEMQKALNALIIKEKGLQGQDLFRNTVLALHVEIGEMTNEWQGFKHWKTNPQPKPKLLEEYIDCLHFFLSIAIQKGWEGAMYLCEDAIWEAKENGLDGGITGLILELVYYLSKAQMEKPKPSGIMEYQTDEYNFRTAWYLFVVLGLVGFDFTLEQIEAAYMEKNAINHKRQETGY
jgi:dimeric dUTPase (all-alpha-NTP-PPase superfamily)